DRCRSRENWTEFFLAQAGAYHAHLRSSPVCFEFGIYHDPEKARAPIPLSENSSSRNHSSRRSLFIELDFHFIPYSFLALSKKGAS
ncbi:MAG: hypothetical protein OEZ45_11330, partial [Candidatus Aminicenantes bacterium]|nr:hypothetical protein [Candidatus Aminicenantes bacterium]